MMDRGTVQTCRVSCQNKFVKLVHLVGFIIKKLKCSMCGSFKTFHKISDDADLGDSTLVDEV